MVLQLSLGAIVDDLLALERSMDTITGFPGVEIRRQSVILTPRFPYDPPEQAGQINQIQSHKMRLTRVWDDSEDPISLLKKHEKDVDLSGVWTFQLSDIPIAGDNHFTNQNIHETTVYQSDDIFGYIDELGYKTETEFWTMGKRWYWGDIIIELTNLLVQDNEILDSLKLKPLSEKWMIRTMVNVLAINDIDSINRGKRQLEALKKEIFDVVKLTVPERSSMDSRVGSKLANVNISRK